jgi:hypothetical protein
MQSRKIFEYPDLPSDLMAAYDAATAALHLVPDSADSWPTVSR